MAVVRIVVCLVVALSSWESRAFAAEWFVVPGGTGNGSSAAPFGRIQDGLNWAQPGDIVTVLPGTYTETLESVRNGTAAQPILIRAQGARGTTVVTYPGTVLRARHTYLRFERLVFDGQYAQADAISVTGAASYLTLSNIEARRSSRDLIDIRATQGVLIENSLIHHALNAANGRTDAHGIVAGAARDLTIRNTEIHTFSGDAFQIDPGRDAPGWDRVTIEGCRMWLAPLPAPENGFAAGVVPGENAVDTKVSSSLPRANITIRDTTAWGFRNGLFGNMAAFNLKENVNAVVDRVTVYDSEIAFRLRGGGSAPTGAWVTIKNAVVYNAAKAFRYEDNIQNLKIWNATIGRNVTSVFQAASSGSAGVEVRNTLVLGTTLPGEAAHTSNRMIDASGFVNAAMDNYSLAPGAAAIDTGVTLPVGTDRAGVTRPQGASYDVGAYEWIPTAASSDEVVVHVATQASVHGNWVAVADSTAASSASLRNSNQGIRVKNIQPYPTHYFEVTAWVEAGKPYRLWIRGTAEGNSDVNDAVYVQFANSVDTSGAAIYRIGTTSAAKISLQDCTGCPLSGWGWQDNGFGANVLGPLVRFTATGQQTVRVQTWEDGLSIDQLVLSPAAYLTAAPGRLTNDTTILPES
jgi:hypothetical protein